MIECDRWSLLLRNCCSLGTEGRLIHSCDRNLDGEPTRNRREVLGVLKTRRRFDQFVLLLAVLAKQRNSIIHLIQQLEISHLAKFFEPLPQNLTIVDCRFRPHVLNHTEDSLVQMMIVIQTQEIISCIFGIFEKCIKKQNKQVTGL